MHSACSNSEKLGELYWQRKAKLIALLKKQKRHSAAGKCKVHTFQAAEETFFYEYSKVALHPIKLSIAIVYIVVERGL